VNHATASPIPLEFPPSFAAFAEHRSIRFFLRKPLAAGDFDLIVEAGRRAPTDAQGHMYSFVRITDPALRDELATRCANQQHIRDAAEFFVVCLDVYRLRQLVEHRGGEWGMEARIGLLYGASDATMVAQNMVVAAETLGYGACYIGAVQNATDVHRPAAAPAGGRAAALRAVHRRHRPGAEAAAAPARAARPLLLREQLPGSV
jgi:FMN reductase (NADPH)